MTHYDALVIGFGKGGKTLAAYLGGRGLKVAMIEKSAQMYGGTCINVGCIPTKALAHQAEEVAIRRPQTFAERAALYRQAVAHKDQVVTFLRQKNYDNLHNNPNVTVITGTASFLSPTEVLVDRSVQGEAEPLRISAAQIFINTGTSPMLPNIPGLRDSKRVYTSSSLMEQSELPRRLTIVGSGYIGLEFAAISADFGSTVTVLEVGQDFLPREDRDVADAVRRVLEAKGVQFALGVQMQSVVDEADGTVVRYIDAAGQAQESVADAVLVAAGRRPNTDGLHLEKAGVQVTERGFIQVDETLRTTAPHIWALGDVNGGPQFTYISLDDYRIVRDQLFGEKRRTVRDRKAVPLSVFITPPLSRVGLTETEARQQGYRVKVASLPAAAIPRARLIGKTDGLLKAVVDADTGRILGATLFAVDSHEVINIISTAMAADLPYTALRDQIFTHPSIAEALNDLFTLIDKQ